MEETDTGSTDAKEKNVYLELWVYKIFTIGSSAPECPLGHLRVSPKELQQQHPGRMLHLKINPSEYHTEVYGQ